LKLFELDILLQGDMPNVVALLRDLGAQILATKIFCQMTEKKSEKIRLTSGLPAFAADSLTYDDHFPPNAQGRYAFSGH
jgi:hypothetical protein